MLVGGEGTRLRPLTRTTPKQMLPVVEQPMIERVLAQLGRHGIEEAVLSLGYRPDAFTRAYPEGRASGVSLAYALESEPLDTAGAIRFAARHAGIDSTFLVVNGDVLTDLDIGALLSFHRRTGAAATVTLTPVEDPSRFGVVDADHSGRVRSFVEKPEPGKAPSNLANAGTYVLEPGVLDLIPGTGRSSVERDTFPRLASLGSLYSFPSDCYWLDAGTPESYLRAHLDLMSGARGLPPAPGAIEVAPGVWSAGEVRIDGEVSAGSFLGAGAVVEAGAKVARSAIGAGARVAGGGSVEASVLLAGSRVEPGALVKGSVLGYGSAVEQDAVVECTSIVGDGATVPAGAHLEGSRLEGPLPGAQAAPCA